MDARNYEDPVVSDNCRLYCEEMLSGSHDVCIIKYAESDDDVAAILQVLQNSPHVKQLDFHFSALPTSASQIVAEFLAGHHHLESVYLNGLWSPPTMSRSDEDLSSILELLLDAISRGMGIQSLTLEHCAASAASLSTLISAGSLQKLVLSFLDDDLAPTDQMESLAVACRANQSIQYLIVRGTAAPLLQSCLLKNLRCLKRLGLDRWCNAPDLINLVSHSASLRELRLEGTTLSGQDFRRFIDAVRMNQSLRSLILFRHSIEENASELVGECIEAADSLETLVIDCFGEGISFSRGWDALIPALKDNTCIRDVTVTDVSCDTSDELRRTGRVEDPFGRMLTEVPHLKRAIVKWPRPNTLHKLASALSVNRTLVELQIDHGLFFDADSLLTLIDQGLLPNYTLKSLHVTANWRHLAVPDSTIDQLAQNLTLTEISFTADFSWLACSEKHTKMVERMVTRNRALAGACAGDKRLDPRLWPRMIQLVLRNSLSTGPTFVFRLLTLRSDELLD